jgi:hypothetical protein
MSIGFTLQILASLTRPVEQSSPAAAPARAALPAPQPQSSPVLDPARRELVRVLAALAQVDRLVNGTARLALDLPVARSDPRLALDLNATAATLQSTQQINAAPHSFTPFGPAWSGASTALLTLGGEYDGSNGTGTLTFESRRTGVHGVNRLQIRVRDPAGAVIRNIDINAADPLTQQYSLGNGMHLTLGSGSLTNGHTATAQVLANVGSAVNPANPFNGVRNSSPNLQYGLPSIINGSFQLNSVPIVVNTGDTLAGVVDRINASGAGVTARFDAALERIVLTQNTTGSAPGISLGADSSNFLRAMKLDTAVFTPGTDPETVRPLGQVQQFSAVQSGNILINGVPVAVDAQVDGLDDVIARINAADAGAVASFDTSAQQLTLAARAGQSRLVIDGNGTRLFEALNIQEGTVDPDAMGGGISQRRAQRITDAVEEIVTGLNALLSDPVLRSTADPALRALWQSLQSTVAAGFGGAGRDSGIGLSSRNVTGRELDGLILDLDRRRLGRYSRQQGDAVREFFNGSTREAGFIQALGNGLQAVAARLGVVPGASGVLLDVLA